MGFSKTHQILPSSFSSCLTSLYLTRHLSYESKFQRCVYVRLCAAKAGLWPTFWRSWRRLNQFAECRLNISSSHTTNLSIGLFSVTTYHIKCSHSFIHPKSSAKSSSYGFSTLSFDLPRGYRRHLTLSFKFTTDSGSFSETELIRCTHLRISIQSVLLASCFAGTLNLPQNIPCSNLPKPYILQNV